MLVKFEPSGTQVQKGKLKVRFDIFPSPTDLTYKIQNILVPDSFPPKTVLNPDGSSKEPKYSQWYASVSKHLQLNPMLCDFVQIDEMATLYDLANYLVSKYSPSNLKTFDAILARKDSIHFISPFMRSLPIFTDKKVLTADLVDLVESVKLKLQGLPIFNIASSGEVKVILPQTIDVGNPVTELASQSQLNGTTITLVNPANATGNLDTFEISFRDWGGNCTDASLGTMYLQSGVTYCPRDSVAPGTITAGTKQTISGQTCDVTLGDYLTIFATTGYLKILTTGGGGHMGAGSAFNGFTYGCYASYSNTANFQHDYYATGTEAGGATPQAVGDGAMAIAGSLGFKVAISTGGGAIGPAGALGLLTKIALGAGAVASSATVGLKTLINIGGGAIASAGSLALKTMLAVGDGAIASAGALGRLIKINLSGTVSIAGDLAAGLVAIFYQAVGDGAVAIAGTLARLIKISVGSGAVSSAGALSRSVLNLLARQSGGVLKRFTGAIFPSRSSTEGGSRPSPGQPKRPSTEGGRR